MPSKTISQVEVRPRVEVVPGPWLLTGPEWMQLGLHIKVVADPRQWATEAGAVSYACFSVNTQLAYGRNSDYSVNENIKE